MVVVGGVVVVGEAFCFPFDPPACWPFVVSEGDACGFLVVAVVVGGVVGGFFPPFELTLVMKAAMKM